MPDASLLIPMIAMLAVIGAVAGVIAGGGVAAVFYSLAVVQAASVLATSRALKQHD